jgi:hypothetical protein
MNALTVSLVAFFSVLLLSVPRRWAFLPLLAIICYVPFYVDVEVSSIHFTAFRALIAVGIIRVLTRGESPNLGTNSIDWAMLGWVFWLVMSGFFHDDPFGEFKYRLGLAYDALGSYFLVRSCCRSIDDVPQILRIFAIVLIPLACTMLYQKLTATNPFYYFGGVDAGSMIREGRVRANGPFGHPILAGTVGAICLPIMFGLWSNRRPLALLGIAACVTIIVCSASSGPILSAIAGVFAVWTWSEREHVRVMRWLAVIGYIVLDLIMKDPAYFLVARIDLAGGSTSWYRARLIQSALEHLPEWWLYGTDRTRDWMWVVVSWSQNHTDITSHYIQMGVWGGVPLLALFVFVVWKGFACVGRVARSVDLPSRSIFMLWTLGASLFALAITGLSVSYFDQSIVILYSTLGCIGSVTSRAIKRRIHVNKVKPLVPSAAAPRRVAKPSLMRSQA